MKEVGELHYHDATFDHVNPDEFEVYFSTLDLLDQIELGRDLQQRFRTFGRVSIEHLQQAAMGVSADQYRLTPETRARRRTMADVLLTREATIEKIQALLVIALNVPSVKSVLEYEHSQMKPNQNTAKNDGVSNT